MNRPSPVTLVAKSTEFKSDMSLSAFSPQSGNYLRIIGSLRNVPQGILDRSFFRPLHGSDEVGSIDAVSHLTLDAALCINAPCVGDI